MKGTQLASDMKFYLDYSKWIEKEGRAETWSESVARVMNMHRANPKFAEAFKNPWFQAMFDRTEQMYLNQELLGSNRALQFGGAPIMKHNSKMYNCLASHADRVEFFCEAMYWLMSGCGVGYSVQFRHVNKLPSIGARNRGTKTFVVSDSIEGWSDAFGVLVSSYFSTVESDSVNWNHYSRFHEYQGFDIKFDLSQIRPKGALISGGFKAPGPEGLKKSLERSEELFEKALLETTHLKPIHVYDLVCHMADAVLSGGVRRSATICVFSPEDEEMMEAKTWTNFKPTVGVNSQRARSNNSVVLVRKETTKEKFLQIIQKTRDWGEPGFYFVDHPDQVPNPCVEIGMWPIALNGRTGWQGCNLCVGNGRKITTLKKFREISEGLAFIGTLQAAYTDFRYVGKESKMIFDREALLGCGICGWLNNPQVLLVEENQRECAQLILETNARVAELIGINQSARTTCVKPDGNTGVLLQAASGIHGEDGKRFFRLMQINKESEISQFLEENVSFMIEESKWSSNNTDNVVYIPVEASKNSIFKKDIIGIKQLEIVKKVQQNWVEFGTRVEACVQPFLRHNVSNTVQVEDWEEVGDFLYENRQFFSGVSFLGVYGALDYKQAPFTPVKTAEELLETYGGSATIFASGLIVDGLHCFNNDLWEGLTYVAKREVPLEGTRNQVLLRKDWIRRVKQFAKRYCKGDLQKTLYCLKEVSLYHKWVEINRELKPLNLGEVIKQPSYTDADTLGSASCVGGACELPAFAIETKPIAG